MKCTKQRVVEEDVDGCKSSLWNSERKSTNHIAGLTSLPGDRTLF